MHSKSEFSAKSSVQKIVDAANNAYYSGKGSQAKVLIELPAETDFSHDMIIDRTILIHFSDNSEFFGTADVAFTGSMPSTFGKHIILLYYDGNSVVISSNEFELNKESFFVSLTQGSSSSETFTVRNNTDSVLEVWVEKNFSHSLVSLSLGSGDDYFTLQPFGMRVVDLNFSSSSFASGNYAGKLIVTAFNSDRNFSKDVFVSIESFLRVNEITIYPRTTLIESSPLSSERSSFSVCNSSSSTISGISWSAEDPNSFIDSLPLISSVNALSCTDFNLDYTIASLPYDANLVVSYNDSNSYTALISFVQE
jgi:hypothetical protein